MYKIAVLISGKGSTLDNLAFHCYHEDGIAKGLIDIVHVIADRQCQGLQVAEKWKIPHSVQPRESLLSHDVDLYVMGGLLSQIKVPEKWKGKILNIHPSLLPAYGGKGMYGLKVHEAVIANKEHLSGCTVHVVDDELDHGEIVEQIVQAVLPWDDAKSLQYAVGEMERKLYPRAILNYLHKIKMASPVLEDK